MKAFNWKAKLLLVLICPLFMYNVCGNHYVAPPAYLNASEYFAWQIPNNNAHVASPDSVTYSYYPGNKHVIISYNSSGSISSYISFTGPQVTGSYPVVYFNAYSLGKYFVSTSNPMQVSIYQFGGPGQDITGNYSGQAKDSTGSAVYNIAGSFKVKNQ